MFLDKIPATTKNGDFNVIIEIPMNSDPVKYEFVEGRCQEHGEAAASGDEVSERRAHPRAQGALVRNAHIHTYEHTLVLVLKNCTRGNLFIT